jgi:hypothetical protein
MDNRNYFIATGAALEKILAWIEHRKKSAKARLEFAKRFGTEEICVINGNDQSIRFAGLVFKSNPDDLRGWRKEKKLNCYVPSGSGNAVKAIRDEMESLATEPPPVGHREMTVGNVPGLGMMLYYPGVFRLGDKWIVSQHEKAKPPEDCVLLKKSEYYAMVEAEEAVKK